MNINKGYIQHNTGMVEQLVDRGDDVSMNLLQILNEESIRGYLDGIRDELLFQGKAKIKEALN